MFTSALSLVASERLTKSTVESSTLPCIAAQSLTTIDIAVLRLSPLDAEDEDVMLHPPVWDIAYTFWSFVHVASSWSLIVWVPASIEQDFVKQLSGYFEVTPISVRQSMHWLKGALARSLTLHNDRITALDSGVLFDDHVMKLELKVSEELTNDKEVRVIIGLQPSRENWRACS